MLLIDSVCEEKRETNRCEVFDVCELMFFVAISLKVTMILVGMAHDYVKRRVIRKVTADLGIVVDLCEEFRTHNSHFRWLDVKV